MTYNSTVEGEFLGWPEWKSNDNPSIIDTLLGWPEWTPAGHFGTGNPFSNEAAHRHSPPPNPELGSLYFDFVEKYRAEIERTFQIHAGQKRDILGEGYPYATHPVKVAFITYLVTQNDKDSVIAALLHDAVEDTGLSLKEISSQHGNSVASMVSALTKTPVVGADRFTPGQILADNYKRTERLARDNARLANAHPFVQLIKLSDIGTNTLAIAHKSVSGKKDREWKLRWSKEKRDTLNAIQLPLETFLNQQPDLPGVIRSRALLEIVRKMVERSVWMNEKA